MNTDLVTFCTKCGANLTSIKSALLAPPATRPSPPAINSRIYMTGMVMAGLIAVVGIPTVIGGMISILAIGRESGFAPHDIIPIVGLLAILGIGGIVAAIWLILRSLNSRSIVDAPTPPHVLSQAPLRQLSQPPSYVNVQHDDRSSAMPSVTEHTTAHLDSYVAPEPDRRHTR